MLQFLGIIEKDTLQHFDAQLNMLSWECSDLTAEFTARMDYFEKEVRQINQLINFFNKYLDPSKYFEFLLVH